MPSKVYLTRTLWPLLKVLKTVISNHQAGLEDPLKMLVLNVHETNVSNLLRFLGFWQNWGYEKFTKFSSSVRFEIVSRPSGEYLVQMVYDEDIIRLPWCGEWGKYCSFEEFD
jgi:hypothetical protein